MTQPSVLSATQTSPQPGYGLCTISVDYATVNTVDGRPVSLASTRSELVLTPGASPTVVGADETVYMTSPTTLISTDGTFSFWALDGQVVTSNGQPWNWTGKLTVNGVVLTPKGFVFSPDSTRPIDSTTGLPAPLDLGGMLPANNAQVGAMIAHGVPGVGVKTANVVDGHLIITLDDANETQIDAGVVGDGQSSLVTVANITDATALGRSLLLAADPAAVRDLTGAGTSNLELGTTADTALAGDTVIPKTAADVNALPDSTTVVELGTGADQAMPGDTFIPRTAADVNALPDTTVVLELGTTATTAMPGDTAIPKTAADVNALPDTTELLQLGGGANQAMPGNTFIPMTAEDVNALPDTTELLQLGTGSTQAMRGNTFIPVKPEDIGAQPAGSYAPLIHTHTASQISDATVIGRDVLTSDDGPTIRDLIGAQAAGDYATAAQGALAEEALPAYQTFTAIPAKTPVQRYDLNYPDSSSNPDLLEVYLNGFKASWSNEWGALRGTSPYPGYGDALLRAMRVDGDQIGSGAVATASNAVELVDRRAAGNTVMWGRSWVDGHLTRNGIPMADSISLSSTDSVPEGLPPGTIIVRANA